MAFAVAASKGAPLAVAGLLKQLLLAAPSASGAAAALRPAPVLTAFRLFSTSATPFLRDGDDDGHSGGEEEYSASADRLRSPRGFSRVVDGKPAYLHQLLEAEVAPGRGCVVLGAVWRSKEDADAVKMKVAMPGLGKEHVKVWVDQDELAIEGEADKDPKFDDDEEPTAWHGHRTEFPPDTYKMDQIEAEMKNGVLMVTVPKMKLEDRKDVLQVKVE